MLREAGVYLAEWSKDHASCVSMQTVSEVPVPVDLIHNLPHTEEHGQTIAVSYSCQQHFVHAIFIEDAIWVATNDVAVKSQDSAKF